MMIEWTNEAYNSLGEMIDYIAQDNPSAAHALIDAIFDTVSHQLNTNPKMGRPGRVEGTRELVVHPSYIVVYTEQINRITILTVRHTARAWPGSF